MKNLKLKKEKRIRILPKRKNQPKPNFDQMRPPKTPLKS